MSTSIEHLYSRPRLKLLIIIASTRPGRVGLPIGEWVAEQAQAHGVFDVDVVDLAVLALPFMDEPHHPRLGNYVHQHTKDWSAQVGAADAFIFVTPEYNHGMTAPLKNALDYLHREWQHKPVGFVSYGGVAAGTRAVQQIKQVVTALRMTPIVEAVNIPFVTQLFDAAHHFQPTPTTEKALADMLNELARVAPALLPLRAPVPQVAAGGSPVHDGAATAPAVPVPAVPASPAG